MRKRRIKRGLMLGIIIAILANLGGCGTKSFIGLDGSGNSYAGADASIPMEKMEDETSKEVTLAVISSNHFLDQAVEIFNGSQTDFQVVIKKFEDKVEKDHEAARMRLQSYLTANKDIDLILADDLDLAGLTEKGWIEDLGPYMEKSGIAKKEDYEPQVLDAGKYGVIQAFIPRDFSLHFLVVPEGQYDKGGWTMEEFLSYCREESRLAGTKLGRLDQILSYDMDYFLDETKGECHFQSREFKELLSWLSELPDRSKEQGYSDSDYREAIANGEIAFLGKSIYSLRDLQFIEDMFEGRGNYVGYPDRKGEPLVRLKPCGTNICMLAKAGNKMGAWKFLEWYAVYREEQMVFLYNIPANNLLLKKLVEEELAQESEDIDAGTGHTTYRGRYPNQKEVDVFYELLSHAKKTPDVNQMLYPLVCQEIMAYFNGQKGLEEVTESIQRQCTLYLQENL